MYHHKETGDKFHVARDCFSQGLEAIEKQESKKALKCFGQALVADPNFAEAYCKRGEVHFIIGIASHSKGANTKAVTHYTKALEDVEQAIKLYGTWTEQSQEARQDCERAKHLKNNVQKAMSETKRGRLRSLSKERYLMTNASHPDRDKELAQNCYEEGISLLQLNKSDEALQKFLKAIDLNPTHIEALYQAGYLCSRSPFGSKRQYEIAIEYLSKAIDLRPNYIDAFLYRGVAYRRNGKLDKAMDDFNQAIKIDPQNARAYNRRGVVYVHQKQYGKALSDYNRAINLNPRFVDAYVNRGNLYQNLGKFRESENDYKTAASYQSQETL